jgi:predicted DNA-binding transcriptional regulator AlpA
MKKDNAPVEDTLVSPQATRAMAGGLSDSSLRRLVKAGAFPQPIALSRTASGRPCRVAYVRSEVLAWCASRIARERGSSAAA